MKNAPRPFIAALALACACAHAQTPAEALVRSIENGDFAELSRLVDTGIDLSTKNRLGETPLYVAAEKGQLEMAKLLIARGADAKAQTPNGESVLHAAAMIESTALMTALIEAGADKNSANNDGETPLHWAAMTGTFLAVKALADAGADLDVQDVRLANTALHAAVSHDDIVMIHYLISKNVRIDRRIIFAASFLRAVANGLIGVLAGIYLAQLGLDPAAWGAVLGAGIAGTAVSAAGVMFWGDRIGRKRWLVGLGVLAAAGGIVFAFSSQTVVLGVAAFLGMLNSLGKDRAAALAIEQAILPSTGDDAGRTRAFAWYNVIQDVGHALGAALAVLPSLLRDFAGVDPLDSLRAAVILYAALYAVTAILYLGLSSQAESPTAALRAEVSRESRSILTKMSFLFALDSFAGGFQGSALFAYFFHAQYGASEAAIGMLFVGARVMNAFSHLGAAWLAARIGLVNTMVFTHTPSSLLTFTIPFTGSFEIAAVLFLLREGLSEMDVPTRQSYLMAVVRPEERTFAGGVTNLARMCARAIAPVFAGSAMQALTLGAPIMAAAGLKILYDVLLYVSFRKIKAPEER